MSVSASLELHFVNVGQGDCVLVVNRDQAAVRAGIVGSGQPPPAEPVDWVPFAVRNGVSLAGTVNQAMLVDGGDDEYGGDVVEYLQTHGVLVPGTVWTPRLTVVVSHYHDDHMAGLRSVFKQLVAPAQPGQPFTLEERYRPGMVVRTRSDPQADPPGPRLAAFLEDVAYACTDGSQPLTQEVLVEPGGGVAGGPTPLVIDLGTGVDQVPVRATAVAASQWVHFPQGDVFVPSASTNPDQNDRSLVLVLEYGPFRCLLGGDVGGNGGPDGGNTGPNAADLTGRRFYSVHADVETTLRAALAASFGPDGHCTVMKANHHASSTSMDVNLLARVRPRVVVISSGVKSRFHRHPSAQVLRRLSSTATPDWFCSGSAPPTVTNSARDGVYLTEMAATYRGRIFDADQQGAKILGDVVVRPVDESVRAALGNTGPLQVQVYGSGVRTTLLDPRTTLRPTEPVRVNPADGYAIGPFYVTDPP